VIVSASSPKTSTAAPVSTAAAKQQKENDDNQYQFHGHAPLTMPACLPRTASSIPVTAFYKLPAALPVAHRYWM
jgi:hypothetical protein